MAPEQSPAAGGKLPFSRIIKTDDAGSARDGNIEASAPERERLAALYRVESIASLTFDYSLEALPSQRYRLTGDVRGALTQLCGVTLEPVAEHISEPVSLEYWPERLLAAEDGPTGELADLLENDPPEPLIGGRIDIGALAAEVFASAINPYPRTDDAPFEWRDAKATEAEAALKPFAGLARLKGKT